MKVPVTFAQYRKITAKIAKKALGKKHRTYAGLELLKMIDYEGDGILDVWQAWNDWESTLCDLQHEDRMEDMLDDWLQSGLFTVQDAILNHFGVHDDHRAAKIERCILDLQEYHAWTLHK